jgi:ABC-type Na+ efflux pump permease subunit
MTLLLIIFAVLIIGIGITFFLMKTGKIEDKDGNNIPDVIDTKIKETKEIVEDVKVKVKRVKEETSDVVKAVKKVTKQVTDVAEAVKGEPRKGRKPKQK